MNKKARSAGWISGTYRGGKKRLFPKRDSASYVKAPRFDANKASAYNLQRSRATTGSGDNTEHNFESNFLKPIPTTRSLSTYDHDEDEWVRSEKGKTEDLRQKLVGIENKNLLELYRVWQSDRQQGVTLFNRIILKEIGNNFRIFLLFNGQEYMFVQEYENTRRISAVYTHKRTVDAVQRYEEHKISWVIKELIS